MSDHAGDKALRGVLEEVGACKFDIKEDMVMTFEGMSCNITDSSGTLVKKFGASNGLVEEEEVLAGYQCYVIKARVKFERKQS